MDNQEVQEARISAHKDTNLVTREQLAALPVVVGTDSFKPVAHIELVVKLQEVLAERDITIRTYDSVREQDSSQSSLPSAKMVCVCSARWI